MRDERGVWYNEANVYFKKLRNKQGGMLKKILHKVVKHRHFWRYATFSEVAEIYIARLLRTFAVHMVTLFVALFLFEMGFSLVFIFCYLAIYYAVKLPLAFIAGAVIARIGPKHATLYANLLYIPALLLFTQVTSPDTAHSLVALGGVALFQAMSTTLYDYAHLVNFSKIKNNDHAGKELSYMHVFEKVANICSPIVGGFIATLFGPTVVMVVAACLFAVSALPLLKTGEPIPLNQRIRWHGFDWKKFWRSLAAESGVGFDVVTSGVLWSLFLAAIVFAVEQENVYAIVGLLTGLGMVISLVSALTFGRIIDRKAGHLLIRYGVITKAIGHLLRPAVGSTIGAAALGSAAEVSSTAYGMALMRGMFDDADRSSYRLTYFLVIEIALNLGAIVACVLGALLFLLFDQVYAFVIFFVCAAFFILTIGLSRFPIYR